MGMYTEIFFRAEIADDPDVRELLTKWTNGDLIPARLIPQHELFQTDRWESLARGSSFYFPSHAQSRVDNDEREYIKRFCVVIHSDIKNYDSEIEKFFDWIDPYVIAAPGDFLGYSLYEDVEPETAPLIYFKKETNA